ncbi:MAG: choice-of-anchor Q domain-containing protein [Bacteroidota bacterium]
MFKLSFALLLFMGSFIPALHTQDRRIAYVNTQAIANGSGESWSSAFQHLQEAIDKAGVFNEIWVAKGTYQPIQYVGGKGERYRTFALINGLKIYGGFKGDESELDQRNIQLYETILSGDLKNNDTDDPSTLTDNVFHVVSGNNTNHTALLDGFTITAGNANDSVWPHDGGGGINNYQSQPSIRNCQIKNNRAFADGGGIRNWGKANTQIENCIFLDNYSEQEGGAIMNADHSNPSIFNCTFKNNISGEDGGAIYNNLYSRAKIVNCLFVNNQAGLTGGAIYNVNDSQPSIINCTITKNKAEKSGGAISNLRSYPNIINSILWGNRASENAEIHIVQSTAIVTYSIISGGYYGVGNQDIDPMIDSENFRLSPNSKAINAGKNEVVNFQLDLAGNPRIMEKKVDVGALEFGER